jgi:cytochrome b
MANTIRVWDLPTRLFHWGLVACFAGLVATGYIGGPLMDWHAKFGYVALALLLFRIVWGVVGGHWSRFTSFIYSPRSVVAYVRGRSHPHHRIGHNPLGAGSVFAMLALLLAQTATGLVGDDEIGFTGPLNHFVRTSTGLAATWYHKQVGQWLIVALVVLHVGAIAYYLVRKKDNLVRPMIVGDKAVDSSAPASLDSARTRLLGLAVLAVSAGLVAWLVKAGG